MEEQRMKYEKTKEKEKPQLNQCESNARPLPHLSHITHMAHMTHNSSQPTKTYPAQKISGSLDTLLVYETSS
jgi:hypothetical protein